ncbi:MAG: hypothetical protein OQK53_02705, partial [Rhodospirillales bacterium]|nr:hypothetical protein [Rhodospirillales bacterium]
GSCSTMTTRRPPRLERLGKRAETPGRKKENPFKSLAAPPIYHFTTRTSDGTVIRRKKGLQALSDAVGGR